MKGIKKFIVGIIFVFVIIDPMGYILNTYAYEFNVWKYKIKYNPITEQEVINTFTETHVFDRYVNEYNQQERINIIVAKLNYRRIGVINTDNNFIYTVYVDEHGKISKVVDGFDDVGFIVELSITRIESLSAQNRFDELPNETKIPFKVKLKILRTMWF